MPQRLGDQRTGAGATARARPECRALGPVDEVGDDQEVAREAHLDDDVRARVPAASDSPGAALASAIGRFSLASRSSRPSRASRAGPASSGLVPRGIGNCRQVVGAGLAARGCSAAPDPRCCRALRAGRRTARPFRPATSGTARRCSCAGARIVQHAALGDGTRAPRALRSPPRSRKRTSLLATAGQPTPRPASSASVARFLAARPQRDSSR